MNRINLLFSFLQVFVLFSYSANVNAKSLLKYFQKPFSLDVKSCQTILVNMVDGKMNDKAGGDKYVMVCAPLKEKPSHAKCDFYDENLTKKFAERTLPAVIMNGQAAVGEHGGGDQYIINLITKTFIGETKVVLDNGSIRGVKVCSGVFSDKE